MEINGIIGAITMTKVLIFLCIILYLGTKDSNKLETTTYTISQGESMENTTNGHRVMITCSKNYDLNQDGKEDIKDLLILQKYLIGKGTN